MKKYSFLSFLIIGGLLASSVHGLLAQDVHDSERFGEFKQVGTEEALSPLEGATTDTTLPRTKMAEPPEEEIIQPRLIQPRMEPEKCGVNTFEVKTECGMNAFKDVYFQCYDGYEEKHGGEASCKSSEVWQKYTEKICLDHCGVIKEPEDVEEVIPEPEPVSMCYISEKLMEEYNKLMRRLKQVEGTDNVTEEKEIRNRIYDLKQENEKAMLECNAGAQEPEEDEPPTEGRPRDTEPVNIDRCGDLTRQEEKLAYYEGLRNLSDAEIIEKTGFPREELGIEEIVAEISENLKKVKEQCSLQMGTFETKPMTPIEREQITEPINPVVPESGEEIDDYYKAKIFKITSVEDIDEQIESLTTLSGEIDKLIERLIKSRKEIEVNELGNVVTEIKLTRGEIKADNITIKTTAKKMLMDVGGRSISIEPTENDVLIRDGGLEVKATELSIKKNVLRVGAAEVKMAASLVAEKLQISPKSVELREEKEKAVYKMKVDEPRKLFGFIPMTIQKTMTADADNGDLLKEQRPWYAFLTTKE